MKTHASSIYNIAPNQELEDKWSKLIRDINNLTWVVKSYLEINGKELHSWRKKVSTIKVQLHDLESETFKFIHKNKVTALRYIEQSKENKVPRTKHIHTYERIKGRKDYFRCIHPDCSHYIHRDLLPNKRALCKCGDEYVLTPQNLKLKTPHCDNCTQQRGTKKQVEHKTIQETLATSGILKDILGVSN